MDQDIQVIYPKYKNISPEETHKWRMPKVPPVPNDLNNFQHATSGIPVSVQGLVYGGKKAEVGASSKSLDRHHELLSSSEEAFGPRKYSGPSEGLDNHVLKRKSPKDNGLVEGQRQFFREQEERVG
ncbi:hypothetical protein O181_123301 [Austropuccinia psidii MF-1]|uniref:Uncharacterized protein n=1 Tax=Austropuccinia psidii MF-1 TaxID=1389203 RepID=A0A9Q3KNZ1_9BASI|nr:hypothetical protein [Austropuccinia psidii MF-1]